MDFKAHKAIYLQIADDICTRILSGDYEEGGKLPSVRELAVQAEVNVNTVARTLEFLQQKDIVSTRRGLGNFVNPGARQAVAQFQRDEFFGETLPEIFATMRTLGIKMEEITPLFEKYQ